MRISIANSARLGEQREAREQEAQDQEDIGEADRPAEIARQIVEARGELVQAGIVKPRLFGAVTEPPSASEVDKATGSAVDMFFAAYGAKGVLRASTGSA